MQNSKNMAKIVEKTEALVKCFGNVLGNFY